MNKKSLTIYRGGTFRLTVKYPTSKVKWSSSNKKVATVNSKGTVVAKKNGKTTITAAMRGKKLRCSVVVKSAPAPSSNPVVNTPSNPIANTPAGGNGSAGANNGGTTTPAQPSTEHVHDWKLVGDVPITYYCGEPLRYVCTACGQMFRNSEEINKHISGFITTDSNITEAEIHIAVPVVGNYGPTIKPSDGSNQFFAMGAPAHQFRIRGEYIYGLELPKMVGGAFSNTEGAGLWNPSSEAYGTIWTFTGGYGGFNGIVSTPKTMVVCSCGAVFANQQCLDMHIKLVNDLNTKLAASMGTTPYLHHKKGTGVECGICRVTHDRFYTCTTCGAGKDQPDNDYPQSGRPQ